MAFSEAQKVKIRTYLGWPAYATNATTLEGAIDLIGGLAEAQTEVEGVLAAIGTIEAEIESLHAIALASKVEESTLNPARYRDLRAAGRRECVRLAALMNADIRRDVFGAGGWHGGPTGWG